MTTTNTSGHACKDYVKKIVIKRCVVEMLLIGAFGALGAVLRHIIHSSLVFSKFCQADIGILFINVLGSFLMGYLFMSSQSETFFINPSLRVPLMVGLLGGFTTYSTFSLDVFKRMENTGLSSALFLACLTPALCIFACYCGVYIVRRF